MTYLGLAGVSSKLGPTPLGHDLLEEEGRAEDFKLHRASTQKPLITVALAKHHPRGAEKYTATGSHDKNGWGKMVHK